MLLINFAYILSYTCSIENLFAESCIFLLQPRLQRLETAIDSIPVKHVSNLSYYGYSRNKKGSLVCLKKNHDIVTGIGDTFKLNKVKKNLLENQSSAFLHYEVISISAFISQFSAYLRFLLCTFLPFKQNILCLEKGKREKRGKTRPHNSTKYDLLLKTICMDSLIQCFELMCKCVFLIRQFECC